MSIDYSDTVGWPAQATATRPDRLSRSGDTSTRAQQRKAWWAMLLLKEDRAEANLGKRRLPK